MQSTSVERAAAELGALDFGYSWKWTYWQLFVAAPFLVIAAVVWLVGAPVWLVAILLIPVVWGLISFFIMRFRANFNALPPLPTNEYLARGTGNVLDLGCGLGRATIMVALARPSAQITAVDNFSASYIKDHGEGPLGRNLRIAGIADRVAIRAGDLLALPFDDESFDALVSSFAIDHTSDLSKALAEARRVLRPGGQFLLLCSVASLRMAFAMLPFYIMSWRHVHTRGDWRCALAAAGFHIDDEGPLRTHGWFLLSRPRSDAR